MVIYPICSSSKGNSTYIESDDKTAILIDAGIGIKIMKTLLIKAGFDLNNISAIFITHEHSDHVSGLLSLTRVLKHIPIYGARATLQSLIKNGYIDDTARLYAMGLNRVCIGDLNISAFRVSHDSACCLAFCVYCGAKKFSICTDLGCVTSGVMQNLKDSDLVLLESNFDVNMLRNGKYPYFLKKRIASRYGHLSNEDAAKLVCWLIGNGVNRFVLGHLSEHNNIPDLAKRTIITSLECFDLQYSKDYFLEVAPVRSEGIFYEV